MQGYLAPEKVQRTGQDRSGTAGTWAFPGWRKVFSPFVHCDRQDVAMDTQIVRFVGASIAALVLALITGPATPASAAAPTELRNPNGPGTAQNMTMEGMTPAQRAHMHARCMQMMQMHRNVHPKRPH